MDEMDWWTVVLIVLVLLVYWVCSVPSGCRFCSGTGIETLDSVDIYGNHSNYEIKCRHCSQAHA